MDWSSFEDFWKISRLNHFHWFVKQFVIQGHLTLAPLAAIVPKNPPPAPHHRSLPHILNTAPVHTVSATSPTTTATTSAFWTLNCLRRVIAIAANNLACLSAVSRRDQLSILRIHHSNVAAILQFRVRKNVRSLERINLSRWVSTRGYAIWMGTSPTRSTPGTCLMVWMSCLLAFVPRSW